MKLLSVVGNRPQFVKSAPVSVALRRHGVEEVVVHTGQHYDDELSAVFFAELGLPEPAYRLDLRTADVEAMIPPVRAAIAEARPDCVLVYGDTNSTRAGAESAVAERSRLVHVEAGLRSGDLSMPEERTRIAVDRVADLLFCPDERSAEQLRSEGVPGEIAVVGDVMADVCRTLAPVARARSRVLERLHLEPAGYAVLTVHREANVQPDRLRRIVAGATASGIRMVFPAHPRTRAALEANGIEPGPLVTAIRPLGYLDFAALASQASVIVTDSGGLQKEAYWYGVPCVTTRPSTEWQATVDLGANVLVDDDPARIAEAIAGARRLPETRPELYGEGDAAERVASRLSGS